MAIGTTTALLIQAGIQAGTTYASTRSQANAVKDSSQIQADAEKDALALQERMYEQTRTDDAPYRQTGQAAMTELARLAGLNLAPFADPAASEPTLSPQQQRRQALTDVRATGREAADATPGMPFAKGRAAVEAIKASPEFATLRDLSAQRQTGSSFVRMRAPDGEEADVSPDEVPWMEQRGARRVS